MPLSLEVLPNVELSEQSARIGWNALSDSDTLVPARLHEHDVSNAPGVKR